MAITCPIRSGTVQSFTIPTDRPEADGTIEWSSTTAVVVELDAGGPRGIGYTYTHAAAAQLIRDKLLPEVIGKSVFDIQDCWDAMTRAIRNIGRPLFGTMAVAAVDCALWDLKAQLVNLPLHRLLGSVREEAPVYGSGGFTTYSISELAAQLGGWASEGFTRVKMKVGADPSRDEERVRQARTAVGPAVALFVDANGAYDRKQALSFAERFALSQVSWFEEPVSSDDLAGLRLVRDRAPAGMRIAAGEYGFDGGYFRQMLEAGAVDVLQADVTRCGGITGFLQALALARAWNVPLSSHCAPSLHVALACHTRQLAHLEYFHDHARVERLLFDGALVPRGGCLRPDEGRPGLGLAFKRRDAAAYAA